MYVDIEASDDDSMNHNLSGSMPDSQDSPKVNTAVVKQHTCPKFTEPI